VGQGAVQPGGLGATAASLQQGSEATGEEGDTQPGADGISGRETAVTGAGRDSSVQGTVVGLDGSRPAGSELNQRSSDFVDAGLYVEPVATAAVDKVTERNDAAADEIREIFNVQPAALTAAEAGYVIGFRDADTLRARAAKARSERSERLRSKGIFSLETTPVVTGIVKEADHAQLDLFGQPQTVPGNKAGSKGNKNLQPAAVQWYANKALPATVRNVATEVEFIAIGSFSSPLTKFSVSDRYKVTTIDAPLTPSVCSPFLWSKTKSRFSTSLALSI
jgi:hypothetical protein